MIRNIPVYYYQNDSQIGPANLQILHDHNFYEEYITPSFPSDLRRWENLRETNLRKFINNHFGFELIPVELDFYLGIDSGRSLDPTISQMIDLLGISNHLVTGMSRSDYNSAFPNVTCRSLNGFTFSPTSGLEMVGYQGISEIQGEPILVTGARVDSPLPWYYRLRLDISDRTYILTITVFDDNLFDENGTVNRRCPGTRFEIRGSYSLDFSYINFCRIQTNDEILSYFYEATGSTPFNINGSQSEEVDTDNPFMPVNDPDGGGDGDYTDPKGIDPTVVPELPTIGASDFVTIYNPTSAQLTAFSQFLWSGAFDLDTFKKICQNPFDAIIGLNVLPCVPASMGSKHIKLGNVDTEVTSNYCSTQWAKVNCGSVAIKTTANSFMDYSPHVKINIFLPFIGFEPLSPDDIMGGSINVTYHIDVVSGDLVCFITHSTKGVLYCYNGNCAATIPISQGNWGGFLKNYYQQIVSVVPAMANGGMAGGMAGAAGAGLVQAFNATSSILMNNKPEIQRSGSMSGAAGIMGVKKPFIIIERPNISVPNNVEHYAGLTSNKTVNLGACSGFTKVDFVHIDGVDATSEEIAEIEKLLYQGVIL